MTLSSLASRHIVITGARRGIGRALAEACVARGAHLTACARSGESPFASNVVWRSLDIRDTQAVRAWIAAGVAAYGPIHALVNNAAVLGPRAPVSSYPERDFREVLDVNVTGTFVVTQAALPHMARPGGVLLHLSSYVGRHALPGYGAYGISKAAVELLAAQVAEEHRDEGLISCALEPGMVRTDMLREAIGDAGGGTPPEQAALGIVQLLETLGLADSGRPLSL